MLNGISILLAEDNPTNRIVAAEMLSTLGARVVVADDGLAALEKLSHDPSEEEFDLLMIDMEMPRLSGAQLIERLRTGDGPYATAPIIVLTAYLTRSDIERAERAGADGFIAKPLVSVDRFGAEIARILGTEGLRPPATAPGDAAAPQPLHDEMVIQDLLRIAPPARTRALIDRAITDIGAEVGVFEAALAAGHREEASASAHRLAGMAGAVGAMRLGARARIAQEEPGSVAPAAFATLWQETRAALTRCRDGLD